MGKSETWKPETEKTGKTEKKKNTNKLKNMKSFVHALKLIGVYFLMYCVFVALSALVVPMEKLQGTQSSEPVRAEDGA